MINKSYVPFLKLKAGEVSALNKMEQGLKLFTPFFDMARGKKVTSESYANYVAKSLRKVEINLKGYSNFFLDDYDIDNELIIDGQGSYYFVCKTFKEYEYIPVVGIDRSASRNNIVVIAKNKGWIRSDAVALRVLPEEFASYTVVKHEISDLLKQLGQFSEIILVIDNKFCRDVEPVARASTISKFCDAILSDHDRISTIVVTGSSVPTMARDAVDTNSSQEHSRAELSIFSHLLGMVKNKGEFVLGDYTCISPFYSDSDIPPEALLNVAAPKLVYPFDDQQLFIRGVAIKSSPIKNGQFNVLAKRLVGSKIFRGSKYSSGDEFLHAKSLVSNGVTLSSIVSPLVNLHMSYMVKDYV